MGYQGSLRSPRCMRSISVRSMSQKRFTHRTDWRQQLAPDQLINRQLSLHIHRSSEMEVGCSFLRTMANKLVSKKSDLEQTLSTINREFGNGSIMRLGDASPYERENLPQWLN